MSEPLDAKTLDDLKRIAAAAVGLPVELAAHIRGETFEALLIDSLKFKTVLNEAHLEVKAPPASPPKPGSSPANPAAGSEAGTPNIKQMIMDARGPRGNRFDVSRMFDPEVHRRTGGG